MYDDVPRPLAEASLSTSDAMAIVRSERSLMEIVANLAGEPGTEQPTCVEPALASIAQSAYKHCSDDGKAALLPMAPLLLETATRGVDTPARLVATCVSAALASPAPERITAEEARSLEQAQRTALFLLRRRDGAEPRRTPRWWVRTLDPVGLTAPVYRMLVSPSVAAGAVAVMARASGSRHDRRLHQLVRWCVAVTR